MPRLFVAVWPPEDVLDTVAALPRPDVDGLRWTGPGQWHVTLRFLGRVDEVDTVVGRLAGAAPATLAAEARLGPAVGRFGRRVLHVPVSGLDGVAAAVSDATADLGRPVEERPFAGHLTLARAVSRRRVDLRPLTGTPITGRWPVDAVCLVESHLGREGARYEVLRRFALG